MNEKYRWFGPQFQNAFNGCVAVIFGISVAFTPVFSPLVPEGEPAIYSVDHIGLLAWQHIQLVALSLCVSILVGVGLGVFVTRKKNADFLPLSRTIVNIGQTFPPVAVLALAVSAVGFGQYPTLIALTLYGLLPIFENTIAGLDSVSGQVLDSAQAMGMNQRQLLTDIELPLAMPLILEGIKVAAVINIGTATIGATVAAKCLGEVIMAGLLVNNMAYVLQGGLVVGIIAVLTYDLLSAVQRRFAKQL